MLRKVGKVDYETDMPGKRKRKKIFHVNMLKKWYPPVDTSYFCEEIFSEEGDAEDKDIPVWKEVESQTTPTIGKHLSKDQRGQLNKLLKQFDKVLRTRPG